MGGRTALLVLLTTALSLAPLAAAGKHRKSKANKPADKNPEATKTCDATEATEENQAEFYANALCLGVTITPYHDECGVEVWPDEERLELCETILQQINMEMCMRHSDGEIKSGSFSRERGELGQPHIGGTYDVPSAPTSASATNEDEDAAARKLKKLKDSERAWMKECVEAATAAFNKRPEIETPHKVPRLVVKFIKTKDRMWHYGYDLKDKKKPWFLNVQCGLTAAFCLACAALYHASVFKNSYAGKKADKSPWKQQTSLKWEQGNWIPLAKWWTAHHELRPLGKVFSLAIIVALSLSTGTYMIDEMIITGKNGGMPLDPKRSDALFNIEVTEPRLPFGAELVSLVETVIHGAPQAHSTTNGAHAAAPGHVALPSTYELVHNGHTLDTLKHLSAQLAQQANSGPDINLSQRNAVRGRFFIFDLLSFAKSSTAAEIMSAAGLTAGSVCRQRNQEDNMCGYLCAGVAHLLHENGDGFAETPCAVLEGLNTPEFLAASNQRLGITSATAKQLLGDEILGLASILHAEAHGSFDVGWMHSPSPFNFWLTFFQRTVAESRYHGSVHIMAVNTESQLNIHSPITGVHWFLAAWKIEPDPEGA